MKMRTSNLTTLFNIGMDRNYQDALRVFDLPALNLGPGNKHIEGAVELDWPYWNAEKDPIPFEDNFFKVVHAYHFLEHISNVTWIMKEINRVLAPGGHVNIVVPYYSSRLQASDLDHKSVFTEQTFEKLFNDKYYKKGKLSPMRIVTNFIMGDEEYNLALVTQLVKIQKE